MTQVTILLEPSVALFYRKIAACAGVPVEEILAQALFMLAGELSLEALSESRNDQTEKS